MSKTQLRGWVKPVLRRNRPVVKIGKLEMEGQIPTMIVVIRATGRRFKLFKGFCLWGDIAYDELDDGVFACCGMPDKLMEFFHQWWVDKDRTHWDHDVHVHGGSGHGDKPKRAKTQRFSPTSEEGAKVVRKMGKEDERHEGASKPKPQERLHGDEALDKLDMQRRREAEEWFKANGLPVPIGNIGPTGKVL